MKKVERKPGLGRDIPPTIQHVTIYFIQKGLTEQHAVSFFKQLEVLKWETLYGNPIRNWKTFALDWIWEMKELRKRKWNGKPWKIE